MCDSCDGLTRRNFLKTGITGAATAALLAACQTQPETLTTLPDVYDDHLVQEQGGGAVHIDRSRIRTLPPVPPQQTEYGYLMPRSAWTNSPLQVRGATPMDGVSQITIHHSGDRKPFLAESAPDTIRHLQIVQQAHLERGMIDIAYHFAVDRAGRVWQLRWLEYEGQHVRESKDGTRHNPHNIGVVVIGDFDLQAPTVAQRDRLFNFVHLARSKYALSPKAVFMHGEIVSTSCPGQNLKPLILNARMRNLL